MNALQRLFALVNAPPLRRHTAQASPRELWQLYGDYIIRPFWGSLIFIALLTSVSAIRPYLYTWAGGVIADDIVEIGHLNADVPAAAEIDPTHPSERRRFAFAESRPPARLADRFDEKPGRPVHEKLRALGWLALFLIVALGAIHVCIWARQQRLIKVGLRIQFRLRRKLHEKMLVLPQTYHDRHSPGELMTHLFSDLSVIQVEGLRLLITVLINIFTILVGIFVIWRIDPALTALVLLALPAYCVCYRWFRKRLRVVNQNLRERQGRLNAHIADRIRHFLVVKSYVRETGEAVDFARRAKPLLRDNLAARVLNGGFVSLCGIITGVTVTLVLWLGVLRVRDGLMTPGTLILFHGSAAILFGPVASLTGTAGTWARVRAVVARVARLLNEPITIDDPVTPRPVPATAPQLRFEDVSLNYDPERPPALKDVSFLVPAGKRLCVMGASGSGRSTLAKLVCRLYDPNEGSVLLDGVDLRHFKIAHLRRLIGFVPQEPIIFSGSLDDNIRYGVDVADDDAVASAARDAQIHDFIQGLPRRYETSTYERGLTLSGGQKQRVNLARALLHDPKVLVMDDCTSALDAQTEANLLEAFEKALAGRTVVIVSHRVSVALSCDLVLMLDGGRVQEFGPPRKLITGDGAFAAVHRLEQEKIRNAEKI
ncbi:MAG: hypothetical protein CMJ18_01695 [Phycisphaeraceae bacterium]|nr:hypothetical protein [Phycisphaeraceae bacterium]